MKKKSLFIVLFVFIITILNLAIGNNKVFAVDIFLRCENCQKLTKCTLINTYDATCKETGASWYRCLTCNHSFKVVLPVNPEAHSWKLISTTPARCTLDEVHKYECTICGETKTEKEPGTATGHNWQVKSTTVATCTKQGEIVYKCQNCVATKSATIPVDESNHSYNNMGVCTRWGYNKNSGSDSSSTTCSHSWIEATCTTPKTCTKCGATIGSALGHTWKNATCTDPKTCTRCGTTSGSSLGGHIDNDNDLICDRSTCIAKIDATDKTWDLSRDDGSSSVTATIDENGIVTIEGTGYIKDYKGLAADSGDREPSPFGSVRSSIKEVHIKGQIKNIGMYLFYYATNLEKVTVENPDLIEYIGGGAFFGCKQLTSITALNNITAIGARAFCHCHSLTTMDLSNATSLARIGHEAFRDCYLLKNVKLPEGLKVIGYESFLNCISLKNLIIPSTVVAMGTKGDLKTETGLGTEDMLTEDEKTSGNIKGYNNVFTIDFSRNSNTEEYESYIKLVLAQNGVNVDELLQDGSISIDKLLETTELITETKVWYYSNCSVMKEYVEQKASTEMVMTELRWDISENQDESVIATLDPAEKLTIAGTGKIYNYEREKTPWNVIRTYIKEVEVSEEITSIGEFLFYYHNKLQSVTLPSTLERIEYGAFFGCITLPEIEIPSRVDFIGGRAFCHCENITSITIPEQVIALKGETFRDCYRLKNIETLEDIVSIGYREFFNCPSLEEFTVTHWIEEVGEEAFKVDFSINSDTRWQEIETENLCEVKYYEDSEVMKTYIANNSEERTFTPIKINKIAIRTNPRTTEYGVGDEISVKGLILTITYEDGETRTLTELDNVNYAPKTADKAGTQAVTITYYGKTATYDIFVHNYSEEFTVDVEPTCTEIGIKSRHCQDCEEIIDVQEIPALGHNYATEFTIDKEATCGEAGSKSKHCTRCDAKTEETVIPATGQHTLVTDKAVAPTCTETGLTEGKHCSVCGAVIIVQEIVPALGHNYENGVCTECGEKEPKVIITSNEYKIDTLKAYITYIQPKTTVDNFKNKIETNATKIEVYKNNVLVENSSFVATGMTIKLTYEEEEATFTLIVRGDVDKNGTADFWDMLEINEHRLGIKTLNDMCVTAGDVDDTDNEFGFWDIVKINQYRLNKITKL